MVKILLALLFAITSCSSTPPKIASADEISDFTYPVSIEELKKLSFQHAENAFQMDMKERRLDAEETTLRDYAFTFEGKTHPPLTYQVTKPWMTQKEFSHEKTEDSVHGPVDIVVDTSQRFLLIYRKNAYLGSKISDQECRLRILKTKSLEPIQEEVKAKKDSIVKDSLFFNSMVLDLDRTLKDGQRNTRAEWEVLKKADPEKGSEIGNQLGFEG